MSWPFLAPAGHAAVNESWITSQRVLGSEAETLGDAGPESLDENIGALDEPEHLLDVRRVLQVGLDDGAAAQLLVVRRDLTGTLNADHIGAEIGQQKRCVRTGSDAR